VHDLLNATGLIDVCIPRGSHGLIKFVRDNAKIPVIETGAGVVHNYIDISADLKMASRIITNAKTRRVSVCNSLDCLLIHQQLLPQLKQLVVELIGHQVMIYADDHAYASLINCYPSELLHQAEASHFGYEFLDYKLAIKTVTDISQAIKHIQQYSSGHSEAIIAQDQLVITQFIQQIDAAALYVNASTAFTDGGEFGMGAEIGISTQKLHARGPMGLEALTSYKWVVIGQGQIR
jgi:glutamate-5-semialdehyde dehydrogenase